MSINVINRNHVVKMKVAICACVILGAVLSIADAGSRLGVYIRSGGGGVRLLGLFVSQCTRAVPLIYTVAPVYGYPLYYGWGHAPIVFSTAFSNVSPVFDSGDTGVYRVPAPIIPLSPIINSPGPRFTWRH